MKHVYRIAGLAACLSVALIPAAASAQRQQVSPEQRIDRLERQVDQMQRQIFPRGRPADTAGYSSEPAATQSSVVTLDQRLDSLERQMSDLLRQSEENGHRLQSFEADLGKLRADDDQRIGALEQRVSAAAVAIPVVAPVIDAPGPRAPVKPRPMSAPNSGSPMNADSSVAAISDPGEDAYTAGFHQWEAGQYDQAIATLKAFTAAYPKHRRVSFANNLIGRAMLDSGNASGAAAVLLANYRNNPQGERAQDSLYYLGQSVMKLGQPAQACNAYSELESVYAGKVRPDLQKLLPAAKAQAHCS